MADEEVTTPASDREGRSVRAGGNLSLRSDSSAPAATVTIGYENAF